MTAISPDIMNPPATKQTVKCQNANRLRGGGAGKASIFSSALPPQIRNAHKLTSFYGWQACFIEMIECFICFGEDP